jgi:holliday junction DNA helicase RuvA
MITRLQGICCPENLGNLTIITGGIGWSVWVPERLTVMPGSTIDLYISWRWNSEQGPSLYGFATALDKEVFELLLSCSGVGPKLGLAALSCYDGYTLAHALACAHIETLSTIPGFGKKRAETVLLAIQDKAVKLIGQLPAGSAVQNIHPTNHLHEVIQALTSLGYQRTEITQTTNWLAEQPELMKSSFEQLLRKGLSYLSNNQKPSSTR